MEEEVQRIIEALNAAGVRYVFAGGLAVIAHGYLRLTQDIDLIIDLERENLLAGLKALEGIGYRPRLPVSLEQFADAETRVGWIREKNMLVFPFWQPALAHGLTVDVFVECPFDFDEEYENAKWMDFKAGEKAPFVGLECLVRMKKAAARPKDLADIDQLRKVQNETGNQ